MTIAARAVMKWLKDTYEYRNSSAFGADMIINEFHIWVLDTRILLSKILYVGGKTDYHFFFTDSNLYKKLAELLE